MQILKRSNNNFQQYLNTSSTSTSYLQLNTKIMIILPDIHVFWMVDFMILNIKTCNTLTMYMKDTFNYKKLFQIK